MMFDYYVDLYKYYLVFLKVLEDNLFKFIVSGGINDQIDWIQILVEKIKFLWSLCMNVISYYYYIIFMNNWEMKGSVIDFLKEEWFLVLQ